MATGGEGKQHVLLNWYIMLIAVLDGVGNSVNNGNIEITAYSDICGGQ